MNGRLNVIDGRLDTMQNETIRSRNSSVTQLPHPLAIPTNALNQVRPVNMWTPRTYGEFMGMSGLQANALLQYYAPNVAVPHAVNDRIDLLAAHFGVRLLR